MAARPIRWLPLLVAGLLAWPAPAAAHETLSTIAPVPRRGPGGTEIRGITLAPIEDQRLGDVGYGSAR